MPEVTLRSLRDRQRALLGWSIGFVLIVLMYAALYPSVRENSEILDEYIRNLPEAVRGFFGESGDISSPTGYIQSELFSTFAPLLFLVFTIGGGSRAVAGEEERKTLDLLLSTPITRRRVALEKFGAVLAAAAGLGVVLWGALALLGPPFDLGIDLVNLAAVCLGCLLLAVLFGGAALAIGCATGSRGLAVGLTSASAVATYIVNALAPAVDALDPLQELSPFYYYLGADPLRNGLALGHVLVLAATTLVLVGIAVIAFDRRDLTT